MKPKFTVVISFGLNLVLAGAAICLWPGTASRKAQDSAATITTSATAPTTAPSPAARNGAAPATFITNRFTWNRIEVDDFVELATNLRAVGCPKKTVGDVIVARAHRALQQHTRNPEPRVSFWTLGVRRTQAQRAAEQTTSAVRAKLRASVEQALGRDGFSEDDELKGDFVSQALVRFVSGPLPEEKFLRLTGLFARRRAELEEFRIRTHGIRLPEDEPALKNLGRQFQQELTALLLPTEMEELVARPQMLKLGGKIQYDATSLSPMDIRTIALLRARFEGPTSGEWLEQDSPTDEQEAQTTKAIREYLGEARYAELERAGNAVFQTLFELGREHNLPRAATVQAFELHQLTEQETARLRDDQSLSAMEKQQQLAQLQIQTQIAMRKVLGADAWSQYLTRGGAWLTNLSGL